MASASKLSKEENIEAVRGQLGKFSSEPKTSASKINHADVAIGQTVPERRKSEAFLMCIGCTCFASVTSDTRDGRREDETREDAREGEGTIQKQSCLSAVSLFLSLSLSHGRFSLLILKQQCGD